MFFVKHKLNKCSAFGKGAVNHTQSHFIKNLPTVTARNEVTKQSRKLRITYDLWIASFNSAAQITIAIC